ncbi:hypothetical protein DFP73DRAFT_597678 [Morchella snyderi]|nr:hypothetical protein DFP73DRAFT_597678 [Morchella snyderi]
MEILGAASAAVGLADVLFKTSLQCYDILSETADTSVNHDHFVWQLNTEKHRLIRWENAWGLTNDLDRNLDPGQYRYAVGTLARIVSLFTSADDLSTKYGIQASNSSQQSGPSAPSRTWLSVRLPRRLQRSPSPSGRTKKPGASEILPGLDASDIRALENPSILESKDLVPGLTEEIKRIQESTGRMQQMLPLYRKLRWAVVDKTRSSHLIKKLKEYNDGLVAILPGPQSPQNTLSTDCQPFLRFHVPIQLPRQRNQYFRGREDLLSEMSTILNPKVGATSHQAGQIDYGPTKKHRIAVLHGLGGMGKSQIATEYAYRHHSSSSYASIFWIDATSQTSLAQSAVIMIEQIIAYYQKNPQRSDSTIKHIGTILGLSGCIEPTGTLLKDAPSASVIKAAKRWLSEPENKDWLIIFDNNDDIDSVKVHDFLPKLEFDHGSTIITTRRPELRCLGAGVEIDEIEENAAIKILLTSAGKPSDTTENDEDYAEARNISKRLGYFPLALDQAGGYISSKQIPISNYLPLYTANYKRVASKSHRKSVERDSHDTVYITWKISFDSLPKPASELLLLCSFLGGVDISEELLLRGKEAVPRLFEDDSLADDALDPLLSFSLARRKIDTQSTKLKLSFHLLVLEWARESLDANDRCGFMEQAICLVGATYKHGLGEHRTMDEWVFGMKILHHINIAVENTQYLLKSNNTWTEETILAIARVAGHCRCHNLVEPGIGILETLLSSLLAEGPSGGMGEAMVVLIALYRESASVERFLELGKKLLKSAEISFGNDHPYVVKVEVELCFMLYNTGRYEESLESLEVLLPISERVLGKEHSTTLRIGSLGIFCLTSLGRGGEPPEAQRLLSAINEKELEKGHPQTLVALHNSIRSLNRLDHYEESVEIEKRIVAGREKVLGHDHPETLDALYNLAISLSTLERFEESMEIEKRVVAGREKVLGHDHPKTLDALYNLAISLSTLERFEESIEIRKRVVAGREKILGHDHPQTLGALYNLAVSLARLERFEESMEIEKRVVAGREKVLGHDHPQTLDALYNLAVSLARLERFEESMEIEKRVVAGREKVLGHDHPETLDALYNLAVSLARLERFEESMEIGKRVVAGREKVLGHDHPETLKAIQNLDFYLNKVHRAVGGATSKVKAQSVDLEGKEETSKSSS